jgi:succinate dehydrogenase/fumarate reductase-like Fe-S protein
MDTKTKPLQGRKKIKKIIRDWRKFSQRHERNLSLKRETDQKQQQRTEHTDKAPTQHDNCDDTNEEIQAGQSQDDRPSQHKRPNQIKT